jgi:hypothetical protein
MNLSDLAAIGSLVSGTAVTASLIYLALQTHQNAKHTKALIHQGRAARIQALMSMQLDTRIAAAVIADNGEDATPEAIAKHQLFMLAAAQRYSFEDSYSQYRDGLLSRDSYMMTRQSVASYYSQPAFRAHWERNKVPGLEFTAFVDGILASADQTKTSD